MSLKLALLGHGNVAQALIPMLARDGRFTIAGIHSRSQPAAPSIGAFLDAARADALVELTTLNPATGEPAISHVRAAFARNMHVVTANKGPIAHAYHDLAAEAERRGLLFRFESAILDGAPVFNQFRNNLPGVRVLGFTGVLNSTSKLIIETMERGGSFQEGIQHAQALGVAEADPANDINGWDSAAKTAALANVLLDARVTPQDVATEGITQLTASAVQAYAREGRSVRLVSRGERVDGGVSLRVSPEVLPVTNILASLGGTSNLILFHTDRMGTVGTLSISPGVEQTAYGVYIDLIEVLGRC